MSKKVILLEFNELTPELMDRFIADGSLPAFERLRRESIVALTDAEEPPPALEPWIQWVTVHTGLAYGEHKVFDLGDGAKLRARRLWDVVADEGKRAWVCGSMNVAVTTANRDRVRLLPDPWSKGVDPLPVGYFEPFYNFVRSYVQEYTRDKPPIGSAEYMAFSKFMITHGLSPRTVWNAVSQLAVERFNKSKWKRAAILDRLQWDVFKAEWKRFQPHFSTFFLNSTAHYQHYYWRNMEPSKFALKDTAERQEMYAGAIQFGYRKMDEIVREVLDLADDDTTIVLATALGQQAMTKYDDDGGKQIYKPRDIKLLARYAGITTPFDFKPVMAEQFHLDFASEAEAADALAKFQALKSDGHEEVMLMRQEGASLFGGCGIFTAIEDTATIRTPHSNQTLTFEELFYPVDGVKSGMHHPDGILWIRLPSRLSRTIDRKIPLTEVGSTLLELAGIDHTRAFKSPATPEIMAILKDREAAPSRAA
ncbi:alkaline phosphatase family protein [Chthonobacter rhizosphaerae]|uniref:alkaline phosphatase family protein n=1 Tax=Chthonobacter rhizosphaerae TaxID=2735553 RepID=UPI0015EF0D13|nr:alkaline phosphatase family protein [Chthonobacter rhizosphaerae]